MVHAAHRSFKIEKLKPLNNFFENQKLPLSNLEKKTMVKLGNGENPTPTTSFCHIKEKI